MNFFTALILSLVAVVFLNLIEKIYVLIKSDIDRRKTKSYLEYGFLSKKDLFNLEPQEFELWCGDFLKKLGYSDIEITNERIDGGKDIICTKNGEKIYVECKKFGFESGTNYSEVSRDIVQKLVGAMVGDNVYNGIILTTGKITERSREYVKNLPSNFNIELIDGDQLIKLQWEIRNQEINKLSEQKLLISDT